jgi:hypothetical protein
MPIIETLSKQQFIDGCKKFSQFEDWSRTALGVLYEELESSEETIEFDPIGYACEWYCYEADTDEDLAEALCSDHDLDWLMEEEDEDEELLDKILNTLQRKTHVVKFIGGVLVMSY